MFPTGAGVLAIRVSLFVCRLNPFAEFAAIPIEARGARGDETLRSRPLSVGVTVLVFNAADVNPDESLIDQFFHIGVALLFGRYSVSRWYARYHARSES